MGFTEDGDEYVMHVVNNKGVQSELRLTPDQMQEWLVMQLPPDWEDNDFDGEG